MSVMPAYRAWSPAPWGWSPFALGSDLFACWDAERSDLITHVGGAVSSWKDIVGGYDVVQAVGAAKPVLSNGYIIPDGADDELTLAPVPAGIPTGAAGCILWWGGDQNVAPSNTTLMTLFSFGGTSIGWRQLRRSVSTGQNFVNAGVGNGSVQLATPTLGDFSGKHCVAALIDGTNITVELDGTASAPTACVPATATTRLRFFAATNTTAGTAFSSIPTRLVMITSATLSAQQKALMTAYIQRRL